MLKLVSQDEDVGFAISNPNPIPNKIKEIKTIIPRRFNLERIIFLSINLLIDLWIIFLAV